MKKRAMKKWIPKNTPYCGGCKWHKYIRTDYVCKPEYKDNIIKSIKEANEKYNKEYIIPDKTIDCKHTDCKYECWTDGSNCCSHKVYKCEYLKYTDLEEYSLLWDGIKACGVGDEY